MTAATVVQLRSHPTPAQRRRAEEWVRDEFAKPVRSRDRSLCQDFSYLLDKISWAAFLAGAATPTRNASFEPIDDAANPLDRLFAQLYDDTYSLFGRAMDEYPVTQGLGKPLRKRPRKAAR